MVLVVIGIICLVIAIFCFFQSRGASADVFAMKKTDTYKVKALQELSQTIAAELGSPGAFKQQVKVVGGIKCANPLTAEQSQKSCVYYRSDVSEKYEETTYEKDTEGNQERKTKTGAKILSSNSSRINFYVEDETGRILINPNNAEIDGVEVINRFEQYRQDMKKLRAGNFSFNLTSFSRDDYRILGYQYNERILPLDIQVYVLGEVRDEGGQLTIRNPSDKGEKFLISHKSEEEILQAKEGAAKNFKIAAIVFGILGMIALVVGLITK